METLTCGRCGSDWQRHRVRGTKPRTCPECKVARIPGALTAGRGLNTTTPGYRMALAVTTYRLAIEEATGALRLGRPDEALAALERVAAPARALEYGRNGTRSSAA